MIPYIFLSFSPLIGDLIAGKLYERDNTENARNKKRKFITIFSAICIFCLISLRSYSLGSTDSLNYYSCWKTLGGLSNRELFVYIDNSRMEDGFLISSWALSHIPLFRDPQFCFVFSGLIIVISISIFLYDNCEQLVLGFTMFICLGLYTFMIQGMRQAIAMSICLLSIRFVKERRIILFFLTIILASQFHQTAIVFFVIYFLYGLKINIKTTTVVFVGGIIVIILSSRLVTIMNGIFSLEYGNTIDHGGYIAVAIYVIILLLSLIYNKANRKENNYCFFFYLTFLGFITYIIRYIGAMAAERVSFYYMAGQLVTLPYAIRNVEKKSKIVFYFFIWLLSVLLFIYRLRGSNLIPYKFFWQ